MKERLQKIIARSGIGSRRKAEEYIRQGRVMVNGRVVTQMGTLADAARDHISVDDVELAGPENRLYVALHKPPGYVSSLHDPEGRKTIDLLYNDIPERLYPVGRLDYDTEGLIVITNDGRFSQLLQHPRYGIPKKYLVKVRGVPPEAALKRLREGVVIDGRRTSRSDVRLVKKGVKTSWCEVVLHEGLNRQLKKMFELIGHPTVRIIRTEIGPLQLGRLPIGTYRFLAKTEIEAVKECGASSGRGSSGPVRASVSPKSHTGSRPAKISSPSKSRTGSRHGRSSAATKPRTGTSQRLKKRTAQ
jgi:pseudouridine synthase